MRVSVIFLQQGIRNMEMIGTRSVICISAICTSNPDVVSLQMLKNVIHLHCCYTCRASDLSLCPLASACQCDGWMSRVQPAGAVFPKDGQCPPWPQGGYGMKQSFGYTFLKNWPHEAIVFLKNLQLQPPEFFQCFCCTILTIICFWKLSSRLHDRRSLTAWDGDPIDLLTWFY